MLSVYDVIKKPLITESTTSSENEMLNKYHFIVNTKASKLDIKEAVEKMFSVEVGSINTMLYRGKPKRFGLHKRIDVIFLSKRQNYKKAVVTLKPDFKIDFYAEAELEDEE
jgi:large subunit ribosomal protein L23